MPTKPTTPPPAYFLSLSLENVRSFGEKQTISFARPDGRPAQWTIILGDNGVGKTTVLKSLAALQPVEDSLSREENWYGPAIDKYWNWKPKRTSAKYAIMASKIQAGNLLTTSSNQVIVNECKIVYDAHSESASMITGVDEEFRGGLCYGYGAGRSAGSSTLSEDDEDYDLCESLFDDRANLINPEEWFLQIDYSIKLTSKNAFLQKQKQLVEDALMRLLPDVEDIRIDSSGTPQKPQITLQFKTPYGWVRLRDMSLGYQTLVVWLTDFASKLFIRYPESKNPLEEPAIVLIDEIDLHLHPSWQRKLIGFLSGIFKNTQFIATAHSPLVVQAAGDEGANVVLLKREGDQTKVYQNLEDVRGWRLDQIMTSELFGLETARSLNTERKLQRRAELLTKTRRTAAQKQELEQLTRELDAEPLGETPSEREVDTVLQELRQRLTRQDASNQQA
jgi:predicted ATP-binding protein involved in virulence